MKNILNPKLMFCIETDNGNLFIEADFANTKIYFFMTPQGLHLTEKRDFHTAEFYKKATETWDSEEKPLPKELIPLAENIVEKYEETYA